MKQIKFSVLAEEEKLEYQLADCRSQNEQLETEKEGLLAQIEKLIYGRAQADAFINDY